MSSIDYFKFLPILITVLAFIIKNLNNENKNYMDAEERYFKDVLAVYISKFRIDNKINPIKFLKQKKFEGSYFIPPYIWKLVNENKKEDLHKVLIVDYKNKYPSIENNEFKIMNKISYMLQFICIILFAVMFSLLIFIIVDVLFIIGIDLLNYFIWHINNFIVKDYIAYVIGLLISFFGLVGTKFVINKVMKIEGDYCTKINVVEKNIKNKVTSYEKIIEENYLI